MKRILLKIWTFVVVFTYYLPAYSFYLLRWWIVIHKRICDKHSEYIKKLIKQTKA